MASLACGAEVVVEEGEVLVQGEGGYQGTGQPDRESAAKEACDLLIERLPNCNYDVCLRSAQEKFKIGERTGCSQEGIELLYCSISNANQHVCLGHHECDLLQEAFEDCWMKACAADPDLCADL